jgi:excisionase family DNA binding protein
LHPFIRSRNKPLSASAAAIAKPEFERNFPLENLRCTFADVVVPLRSMNTQKQQIRRTETRLENFDPARAEAIRRDPPAMLSLNEAAAVLGIATRTVRQRISDRSLPHVKLGGRVLVPRDAMFAAIAARTIQAVTA